MAITKISLTLSSLLAFAGCVVGDGDITHDDPAPCTGEQPTIRLGGDWVKRSSGTLQGLNAVVWTGERFVVSGYFDSLLVSEDAESWRAVSVPDRMHALAWSGSSASCDASPESPRAVAVGRAGTILSSPDGLTWTAAESPTENDLYAVAWTGDFFVAAGGGGMVMTSPDGMDWESRNTGTSVTLRDIAWNDSMLVVVGDAILSSPDGTTWTARATGSNENTGLRGVAWTGTEFMADNPGSPPQSSGHSLHSPDGVTWARGFFWGASEIDMVGSQLVILGGTSDVVGEAFIEISPPAPGDTLTRQELGEEFMAAGVAWNGMQLVVVGSSGTIMTLP